MWPLSNIQEKIKQTIKGSSTQTLKNVRKNMHTRINSILRVNGGHIMQDNILINLLQCFYYNAWWNYQITKITPRHGFSKPVRDFLHNQEVSLDNSASNIWFEKLRCCSASAKRAWSAAGSVFQSQEMNFFRQISSFSGFFVFRIKRHGSAQILERKKVTVQSFQVEVCIVVDILYREI